jgi:hypothetical protein
MKETGEEQLPSAFDPLANTSPYLGRVLKSGASLFLNPGVFWQRSAPRSHTLRSHSYMILDRLIWRY